MIFRDFFRRRSSSKNQAKERLQLLLVQDRFSLSPEIIDKMRGEIIDVISHYVEVDQKDIEIELKRKDERTMLFANIPVKNVKR